MPPGLRNPGGLAGDGLRTPDGGAAPFTAGAVGVAVSAAAAGGAVSDAAAATATSVAGVGVSVVGAAAATAGLVGVGGRSPGGFLAGDGLRRPGGCTAAGFGDGALAGDGRLAGGFTPTGLGAGGLAGDGLRGTAGDAGLAVFFAAASSPAFFFSAASSSAFFFAAASSSCLAAALAAISAFDGGAGPAPASSPPPPLPASAPTFGADDRLAAGAATTGGASPTGAGEGDEPAGASACADVLGSDSTLAPAALVAITTKRGVAEPAGMRTTACCTGTRTRTSATPPPSGLTPYSRSGPPPSLAGASHLTSIAPSPSDGEGVATTSSGGPGGPHGTTPLDAALGSLSPHLFLATTRKDTAFPNGKFRNTARQPAPASTFTGACRPTTVTTVYCSAMPNSSALHVTVTVASLLTLAVTLVGGAGGPVGTTEPATPGWPAPIALTALTANAYAVPFCRPRMVV